MSFLKRLKEEPSHVKTRYAFVGATVMTVAIALVWTTTLPARFGAISASIDSLPETTDVASIQNGFDALISGNEGNVTEGGGDTTLEASAYSNTLPDGALGDLGGWSEPQSPTVTPLATTSEPQTTAEASIPTPQQQASSTPPTSAPQPTVILIGTTTKKAE